MKSYKICVYAIAKNESKFVKKWVNSMKEADEIYVLDTGSTDNTVELLKKYGAHVKVKKIDPWRFDVARNESLKLVPMDTDICVCTDLDEVFEKGRDRGDKGGIEDDDIGTDADGGRESRRKRRRRRTCEPAEPEADSGKKIWGSGACRHGPGVPGEAL